MRRGMPMDAPRTGLLLAAALATLAAAGPAAAQQQGGPTYYVAADEVSWNYAPSGINLCNGEEFSGDPTLYTQLGVGSVYSKAQYRQYTDASFQTLQPKPASEVHTGLLGPVLRASVGQLLTVVFRNNLPFPVNLQPAGLVPANASAAGGAAAEAGAPVAPNATLTYEWLVPADMGPDPGEPSTKLWLYRSSVDLSGDANAGLLGPLLVSNVPEVNTGDVGAGQERDVITVLQILDENSSPFLQQNLDNRTAAALGVTDAGLSEANLKHAINGFVYCNTPGMEMTQGERVRWHMAAVGSETDMHNLHFHGNTFLNHGHRADQVSMIPGSTRSVQFNTDNAGFWLMHCHVGDHINAGMKATYLVDASPQLDTLAGVAATSTGTVRTYYIEAEEVEWDYAPRGGDFCSGALRPWTPEQAVFTEPTSLSLGNKFLKARYVEYTNASFTVQKQRSAQDAYLGLLGPVIRAEVGDTIVVVFRNSLRFPATVHPHGVAYLKNSEGSPYFDGTMGADKLDDAVEPGVTYTYTWQVAETSGPGPADPSTVVWMYHSHHDEVEDVYAGLVGALVIGRKGALLPELTPTDVDREVVLLFMVTNEVNSLYADVNARALGFTDVDAWESVAEAAFEASSATDQQLALQQEALDAATAGAKPAAAAGGAAAAPAAAAATQTLDTTQAAGRRRLLEEEEEEEGYEEPMLKHGINGFLYCNGPQLTFNQGDRVRFHVLALGSEVDMHTPNFVGQSLEADSQRSAAVGMMPGAMHSVDITMANPGTAVVQCRVADHITAGMQASIKVLPTGSVATQQNAAAAAAVTRRYYVAAEEVLWDYVPLGLDGCTGEAFGPDAEVFVAATNATIGANYTKARFVGYTDASFSTPTAQPEVLGILGPTLVAEVGQALEVVFLNRLPFDANIMLDGGLELLPAGGGGDGAALVAPVAPGANATYRYYVPESAGPADGDLSTVAYAYTSSVDLVGHPNAGLIGVLAVGAPGSFTGADGEPAEVPQGVDAMLPLLFTILDEGASPYLQENMEAAGLGVAATFAPGWGESNLMHGINGRMYCNLAGLEAARGATLRLLLLGMGSEADMHSPVFEGQVLRGNSSAAQTAELMPTLTRVVDLDAAQPGSWPLYCAVHDHYVAGMRATLVVK